LTVTLHDYIIFNLNFKWLSYVPDPRVRYDDTCAQKLTNSQLNLPHGTKQKRVMRNKNRDAQ